MTLICAASAVTTTQGKDKAAAAPEKAAAAPDKAAAAPDKAAAAPDKAAAAPARRRAGQGRCSAGQGSCRAPAGGGDSVTSNAVAAVGDVANGASTDASTGACAGFAAVGDAANGASVPPALACIAGAAQAAAVRPLQPPPCRPCRSRPAGSGRANLPHEPLIYARSRRSPVPAHE